MNAHKPSGYPDGTMWDAATVCRRIGISRQTLMRWRKDPDNDIPRPQRKGPRLLRWEAAKVLAWIESKGEL